jgi:hypothetical protein
MGRAVELKLDLFGKESAAEFLQKRAGRNDPAGAGRLAAALGHLPLALDHAGAYCRLTGSSFDAYREKIDTRIARAPTGAAYPASVAATFALAIEQIVATHPQAETLLGCCAFLASERIPLDLVADAVADEDERAEALMACRSSSTTMPTPRRPSPCTAWCRRRCAHGSASVKAPTPSARRSRLRRRFPSSLTAIPRSGRNAPRCSRMCWRSPSVIGRASTTCPRPAAACSI